MKHHPLTPMTDSNLVAVLQRQTSRKTGLLRYDTISQGADAVRARIAELRAEGVEIAVADSLHDEDLHALATGCAELPLLTAGSGVAIGLPANFRAAGKLSEKGDAARLPAVEGAAIIISGSCSSATLAQIASYGDQGPRFQVDPMRLAKGQHEVDAVIAEAVSMATDAQRTGKTALIHASAEPEAVKAAQQAVGRDKAGELVEQTLAACASQLAAAGTRRFVIAGGETSGAVVQALNVDALRIGPQIDPGVPWTETIGETPLAITLKSGNFGAVDFFSKALKMLDNSAS